MTAIRAKSRNKTRPTPIFSAVFRLDPSPRAEPLPSRPVSPDLPASPEWRGWPWPCHESEIDLPDEPPPPMPSLFDASPVQYVGSVRAGSSAGERDLDVIAEGGDWPAIWIGPLRLDRIQALRLCNLLLRALREDGGRP